MHEREELVMGTFIELGDTLASDYDIGELLHLLVERCAEVFQLTAGAVMVEGPDGIPRLAAATSDEMQVLGEAEIQNGEGPCLRLPERGTSRRR